MQNTFSLGPLNLPALPVILIVSVTAGHIILKLIFRKRRDDYRSGSDLFFTGLLLFLAGWKLSLLGTNWSTITRAPLALLYLTGGAVNLLAGLLLAAGGMGLLIRKGKYSLGDIRSVLLLCTLSLVFYITLSLALPEQSAAKEDETGNITVSTLEGRPQPLDPSGAPVTIVNFWATWCPPCRAEIPEMIEFYSIYAEKGVRLIGVNMTTTESSVREVSTFMEEQGINFPVLLDSWGDAAARYEINSIPVTMVFDSEGNLIRQRTGAVDSAWLKASVRNYIK